MSETSGRNIVLGVAGSIAAYKAASVLRGLLHRGHAVQVVMTQAAQQFVTPTTFRSLSGRPVVTDLFIEEGQASLQHVELADWVCGEQGARHGVLAVVPATADFVGKAANGLADEMLSCTWMACDCPKVVAAAMNNRMWNSPPMQENWEYLRLQTGVHCIDPVMGVLADGRKAVGHLAPVEDIVNMIHSLASGSRVSDE
ncbi:MAG: flavoprotein [Candidatus Brocadiia bacterium]